MTAYKMDDNTVVNTNNATNWWSEDTYFDGNNHISAATGSQWNHETLYRSRKGRYYVVWSSQYQGSQSRAEWISNRQAALWLLNNDHILPDELGYLRDEVEE